MPVVQEAEDVNRATTQVNCGVLPCGFRAVGCKALTCAHGAA